MNFLHAMIAMAIFSEPVSAATLSLLVDLRAPDVETYVDVRQSIETTTGSSGVEHSVLYEYINLDFFVPLGSFQASRSDDITIGVLFDPIFLIPKDSTIYMYGSLLETTANRQAVGHFNSFGYAGFTGTGESIVSIEETFMATPWNQCSRPRCEGGLGLTAMIVSYANTFVAQPDKPSGGRDFSEQDYDFDYFRLSFYLLAAMKSDNIAGAPLLLSSAPPRLLSDEEAGLLLVPVPWPLGMLLGGLGAIALARRHART